MDRHWQYFAMSLIWLLFIFTMVWGSTATGIYIDRRRNRRPVKMILPPSPDRLLAGVSSEDTQWLTVFRETVMASDGKTSPFLESWLDPKNAVTVIARAQELVKGAEIELASKSKEFEKRSSQIISDACKQAEQILSAANQRALTDSKKIIDDANERAALIISSADGSTRNRAAGEAEYMLIIKEANRKKEIILNAAKNKAAAIETQAQAKANAIALVTAEQKQSDNCPFPNCKNKPSAICSGHLCWRHCQMSCVCGF